MDWLDARFFRNSVQDWLVAAAIAAVAMLVVTIIRRLVRRRFTRLAESSENIYDDALVAVFSRTSIVLHIAIIGFVAVWTLSFTEDVEVVIRRGASALFLAQLGLWGNRFIRTYTSHYKDRHVEDDAGSVMAMQAVGIIALVVLWAAVLLAGLANFGIDVTALVAGLGIGGIAVALALQNVLGDLFAALAIVLDKPFVIGDFLIIGDYMGAVEHIGLKTTRIRSLGGEQIVFSNSDLLGSRIRNYKRMIERRIVFEIGLTYDTPPEKVERAAEILRETVEAQEDTRFDRAHFKSFGDSALEFECVYYVLVPDYARYMDIQQTVNLELMRKFDELGVEFAFPTQTIHLAGGASNDAGELVPKAA